MIYTCAHRTESVDTFIEVVRIRLPGTCIWCSEDDSWHQLPVELLTRHKRVHWLTAIYVNLFHMSLPATIVQWLIIKQCTGDCCVIADLQRGPTSREWLSQCSVCERGGGVGIRDISPRIYCGKSDVCE